MEIKTRSNGAIKEKLSVREQRNNDSEVEGEKSSGIKQKIVCEQKFNRRIKRKLGKRKCLPEEKI